MPEDEIPKPLYLPDPESPFFADISRPDFNPMEMIAHLSWQQIQQELGREVVEFQFLETTIKDAIGKLLDSSDPSIGELITAELTFAKMLGLLFALFDRRYPDSEHIQELEAILKECDARRIERNRIIHSYWYKDDDGNGVRMKFSNSRIGKPSEPNSTNVLSDTLRAESEKCITCSIRLYRFIEAHCVQEKK
jgi:hypothetical protein